MYDPAWIIMKLSIKPNPIIGTADDNIIDCICCHDNDSVLCFVGWTTVADADAVVLVRGVEVVAR
jgi:hypothetical protein